jgi:hypothetical protein
MDFEIELPLVADIMHVCNGANLLILKVKVSIPLSRKNPENK